MNIGNIGDGPIVPLAFRPVVSKGQRNQEPSLLAQKTSCARFFLEKDSFGQFLKARFLFYTLDCVVKIAKQLQSNHDVRSIAETRSVCV